MPALISGRDRVKIADSLANLVSPKISEGNVGRFVLRFNKTREKTAYDEGTVYMPGHGQDPRIGPGVGDFYEIVAIVEHENPTLSPEELEDLASLAAEDLRHQEESNFFAMAEKCEELVSGDNLTDIVENMVDRGATVIA